MSSNGGDVEAARAMILQGEAPLSIRKFFPSFKDAVRFYAAVRAEQFGIGSAAASCCACRQVAGHVISEFQWTAMFSRFSFGVMNLVLLFLGHVRLPVATDVVGFSTFHGFCHECWRKSRRMRWLRGLLEAVSLLLILAGLTAALGCGLAPVWLDHLTALNKTELFAASAGGVLAIATAITIRLRCRLLGTPPSLLAIAPRPFQLHATMPMEAVTLSGSAGDQVVHVPKYRREDPSAMSWQQTVAVLLIVFVGVPGVFMTLMPDLGASAKQIGWVLLGGSIALVWVFFAWHMRNQKKIRESYYQKMAKILAESR